jgi:NAD(P)-dependent dehydrogenase (short-subunit alcohol dehydrogenase family)
MCPGERVPADDCGAAVSGTLFSLAGKTALVTGGAQGLGRMIAEGLLRAGATVAITSRKAEACEAAAAEMAPLGRCVPLAADLATPEAVIDLVARYRAALDRCDILVNNAGKTWGGPVDSFPDKGWPGVMAVNVQAPLHDGPRVAARAQRVRHRRRSRARHQHRLGRRRPHRAAPGL